MAKIKDIQGYLEENGVDERFDVTQEKSSLDGTLAKGAATGKYTRGTKTVRPLPPRPRPKSKERRELEKKLVKKFGKKKSVTILRQIDRKEREEKQKQAREERKIKRAKRIATSRSKRAKK